MSPPSIAAGKLDGSNMSAATTVVPGATRGCSASGRRVRQRTRSPADSSCVSKRPPTYPVAPVKTITGRLRAVTDEVANVAIWLTMANTSSKTLSTSWCWFVAWGALATSHQQAFWP
jgi:hypothetical protein